MTDQTDRLIEEVQSKNKAENYERENTIKLHTLQIYGMKLISLIILQNT